MKYRILTGSHGFIGTRYRDRFKESDNLAYKMIYIDRKNGIDLASPNNMSLVLNTIGSSERGVPSSVINMAAITQVQDGLDMPGNCLYNNTILVLGLCEFCRMNNIKLIHFSTDKVYGENDAAKETDPLNAEYPYDVSKKIGEEIIQTYVKNYGLKALIVRPCNVYGDNDPNKDRLIPLILDAKETGKRVTLRTDGRGRRDYIHVDDLLDALDLLIEKDATGIYNISSGENYSAVEVLDMAGVDYEVGESESEIKVQHIHSDKLRELDWEPKHNLKDFLNKRHEHESV